MMPDMHGSHTPIPRTTATVPADIKNHRNNQQNKAPPIETAILIDTNHVSTRCKRHKEKTEQRPQDAVNRPPEISSEQHPNQDYTWNH